MNWIKGLVAPPAFGQSAPGLAPQAQQPGYPPQGGPPVGGAPSPYGVQPIASDPQGALPPPAPQQPQVSPPYDASALNQPMQWSVGTKTQGAAGPITSSAVSGATTTSVEARCAQLQHDVESLALFARTLLTMLEESKLVTREQFDATKNRLDMLDGKLDDR